MAEFLIELTNLLIMIFKYVIIYLIILINENNEIRGFYTSRRQRETKETIERKNKGKPDRGT